MRIVKRVLFDLDGILADFHGQVLKFFALDVPVAKLNSDDWIRDVLRMTEEDFWRAIDAEAEKFWTGIEPLADGKELLHMATDAVGIDNIGICSSPSRNPASSMYKMKWVREHHPYLYRQTIITSAKYLCSSPGTLLIDDWEKNAKFADHGGMFHLYPRPWNSAAARIPQAKQELANVLDAIPS